MGKSETKRSASSAWVFIFFTVGSYMDKTLHSRCRRLGWILPLSVLNHISLLEKCPSPHVTRDLEWLALINTPSLYPLLPLPSDFCKWLRSPNISVYCHTRWPLCGTGRRFVRDPYPSETEGRGQERPTWHPQPLWAPISTQGLQFLEQHWNTSTLLPWEVS